MSPNAERDTFSGDPAESRPWLTYAYAFLVMFMVTCLLIWQGMHSVRTFEDAQRQIALYSVNGTADEIEAILGELHRSVGIFAKEKAEVLRYLAGSPGDRKTRDALDRSVSDYFPEVHAWALSSDLGDTLLEEEPWLIGEVCRMDIQDYALRQLPHGTRIHANPNGSHFDIMATVPDSGDQSGPIFFASVSPVRLTRILENSQAPGHQLYLLLTDVESARIEVSARDWASTYGRPDPDIGISPENTLHTRHISGSRWNLVDVVDPALIRERVRSAWIQGIALFLTILAATILMLYLLRRNEKLRSKTQVSLRESHATLAALIEGVAGGVYLKDAEGKYLLVNDAYACWAGREAGQLIGRTDREVLPERIAESHEREDARVISTSTPSTLEEDDPQARGRTALVSRTPYLDTSGGVAGLVGIRHDITELKQTRERLHRQEIELAHIDRLGIMGELAASLAHELNQPLGAISNYAHACLRIVKHGNAAPEQLVEVLEDTVAQARRAGEIIQKARAFVRKDRQNPECTNLAELIGDALDLAGTRALSSGIQFDVDVAPEVLRVHCDKHQIKQVILNLIFNAMEAISPGPGRVEISVRGDGSRQVRVTVSDDGPGLATEIVGRVFEPFYTTKTDGTGMGLALCRSIVESHAGHIWADEPEPGGARFHFTLPEDDECRQ
jgi:two-component system sensor kinase FixL